MANVIEGPDGRRRVQFMLPDGRTRKTLALGKATERDAGRFADKIEQLIATVKRGDAPDEELTTWLRRIGDDLHAKLVELGLAQQRNTACPTLAEFIEQYKATRKDVADTTRTSYHIIGQRLIAFFNQDGKDQRLNDISPGDADSFAHWLRGEAGYALATAAKTIKMARQMFKRATRLRFIAENPFEDIKAGNEKNRGRSFFVTAEAARQVIAACPDHEWRLLFALARYGGLRNPSETLELTWPDIFWDQDRFRVHSPKTEHQGKPERLTPLFPELRPFLEEAFELAEPGAQYVITRYRDPSLDFHATELA